MTANITDEDGRPTICLCWECPASECPRHKHLASIPVPTSSTEPPKVIWLQQDGRNIHDWSWCADKIDDTDIEYRLAVPAIPSTPNPELEAALSDHEAYAFQCGASYGLDDVASEKARKKYVAARAALVSLYTNLQQENERLAEGIERLHVLFRPTREAGE